MVHWLDQKFSSTLGSILELYIDLSYPLKDVEAIKVEIKSGAFNQERTLFLKLKSKREIPLTGIGEPLTLKEIEKQASELANFLQVSLEGL